MTGTIENFLELNRAYVLFLLTVLHGRRQTTMASKGSPNPDSTMESKYIYSPLFIVFFADVAP